MPSSVTLPRSGSMRNGRVYARPMSAHRTVGNDGSAPRGLPTPLARDSKGASYDGLEAVLMPTPRTTDANGTGQHGSGGPDLRTVVSLLPTPRASTNENGQTRRSPSQQAGTHGLSLAAEVCELLPTPRASDTGTPGRRASPGFRPPLSQVLLPTPMASDSHRGANAYTGGRPTLKGALLPTPHASAVQGNRWGDYAVAIARWEIIMRRDAPESTEPGSAWHRWRRLVADRRRRRDRRPAGMRGTLAAPDAAHRRVLAVRLVEWMMGLADGWVTSIDIPRNAKLRLLGNGVVPAQAAAAVRYLLNRIENQP